MQNSLSPTTLIGVDAPLPTIDLDKITKIVADTYDFLAPQYPEQQYDSNLAEPLDEFARFLLRKKHKPQVLDIGCGLGWEVSFLLARGFNVVGIDASPKMIERASEHVSQGNFYVMKMQDLQFPEGTFDAIWSAQTSIHIPRELVVDLLASWKRVLKPGGSLGISVVIGERKGWEVWDNAQGRSMFNQYFAEGELEEILKVAGYHVLKTSQIKDASNADNSHNFFIFAQRAETSLDKANYSKFVHYDEHTKQWLVKPEDLEQVIALFLRAGILTPREQVNLCLLYDKLAQRDRSDENQYKLVAQKLKLHLQTPDMLSSQDFDVWLTLGKLHIKLYQFRQAVSCLELAHELHPDNFPMLIRLGYGYEGLTEFDKAIATAHEAEQIAEQNHVSDEEKAELYHALGHFYISRSHVGRSEISFNDREKGRHYMETACSTGNKGQSYISCLASIYNETKNYPETIRLFDGTVGNEDVRADEELYNEMYFYHGEACIGLDRYANALADFDHVERYARAKQDHDALAHVRLYQVRTQLKRKDVRELSLDEISSYLTILYEHEPSPYVAEALRRDRERLISILSAFYLLKQCLDEHEPLNDFTIGLAVAISYMEKMYEKVQDRDLHLLVLAGNLSTVPADIYKNNYAIHLYSFDEVGTELTERDMEHCRVWAVLALGSDVSVQPSLLASITFFIGRFYRDGYTIYIYDPDKVFPETVRKSLQYFFVNSIDDLKQFAYMNMLYDKSREYLSITRMPLGLAPITVAPARTIAQAENLDLLPLERIKD